jgi:hypothetical protein
VKRPLKRRDPRPHSRFLSHTWETLKYYSKPMSNVRRIPSYIVPVRPIRVEGLTIKQVAPVTVYDDWNRKYWCGSLEVDVKPTGKIGKWIYFHSLLADSCLPIYAFQAFGHEPSDFNTMDFDPKKHPTVTPREINFNPDDVLPAVYLDYEPEPTIKYDDLYKSYLNLGEKYFNSLKNYFLAIDINFNKRLRSINPAYWQVVMLISAMEALLPTPTYCTGVCEVCKEGLHHPAGNIDQDWKNLLFGKIQNKDVRKQYRLIFDVARREIRNHTVHNGLMPSLLIGRSSLPDGVTEFTTQKAIDEYKTEDYSLESLVEQFRQMCRYVLLDQLTQSAIFPGLKGIEVHSKTITDITSSKFTFDMDF